MPRLVIVLVAIALARPAAAADRPIRDKEPWGALTDIVGAGEIVLRDVCLPGILENRPIAGLADYEWLVPMPPKSAHAGPDDKVWRLASLSAVYAVAWADGSCSTYVELGPSDKLRAMAERVIMARPEGFARGASAVVDNGRVERTVFCATVGEDRLVATITTPNGRAKRGTMALSSTVYRAKGPSPLCAPG